MEQRTLPLILAATMLCRLHKQRDQAFGHDTSKHAGAGIQAGSQHSAPDSTLPTGAEPVNLNPADFTADISHPYWPMKPGTRWTYRDVDEKGEVQTSSSSPPRPPRSWPTASQREWFGTRSAAKETWSRTHSTGTRKTQRAMSGTWGRTLLSSRTARSPLGQVPSRPALGGAARHPAARRAAGRPKVPPGISEGRG